MLGYTFKDSEISCEYKDNEQNSDNGKHNENEHNLVGLIVASINCIILHINVDQIVNDIPENLFADKNRMHPIVNIIYEIHICLHVSC